jgi:hypothetical protein
VKPSPVLNGISSYPLSTHLVSPVRSPHYILSQHKGFSEKLIAWIRTILSLSSDTSSVLLNGIPWTSFSCKRGVKQGDPHFCLLQSVVNKAVLEGDLVHPLGQDFGGDFPIVQYADDTSLVFSADPISWSTSKRCSSLLPLPQDLSES